MGIILKVEHQNWGMISPYDWQWDKFELSSDGELHIVVQYFEPIIDCVVKVSERHMKK